MVINYLEFFNDTVAKYPSRTAVIDGERKISFSELDKNVKFLSGVISKNSTINQPIAVYLPKCIDIISVNIAIIHSGDFYMNLDVKSPGERILNTLKLIKPSLIITNSKYLTQIKEIVPKEINILNIDEIGDSVEAPEERWKKLIDTDPLCIINTSGSTGTPKGVVLNHKSFIDFTEWAIDTLKLSDKEIIGSLSPVVFDIYSHELCMLMKLGSTMVLLPDSLSAFPFKILEILKTEKITYLFWVPTIMVNIANMDLLSKIELRDLKTVWFAGEVFPTKQFNYWFSQLPNVMFVNLYGPIEITLDCTYYIANKTFKDKETLPIGIPCRNTSILILNKNNELCKTGEEGELCVRGTSLAMGYYNNPEKTAAVFTQNPLNNHYPELIYRTGDVAYWGEDGNIYFKGRMDTMIKHLGYRIELAEIEHVIINKLKIVQNCCAVYHKNDKELILFYEGLNDISPSDFRKSAGSVLPKYMIPAKLIRLEKMPMNNNGKIDRLSLNIKVND